jgi:hypothetical protein
MVNVPKILSAHSGATSAADWERGRRSVSTALLCSRDRAVGVVVRRREWLAAGT